MFVLRLERIELSTVINFYLFLSTVINCYQLLSTVINFNQLLSTVINFYQLLSTVVNFYQLLSTGKLFKQRSFTVINSRSKKKFYGWSKMTNFARKEMWILIIF